VTDFNTHIVLYDHEIHFDHKGMPTVRSVRLPESSHEEFQQRLQKALFDIGLRAGHDYVVRRIKKAIG
jgi:hypothetical protein